MAKWIFLEDFHLKEELDKKELDTIINVDFIMRFELREKTSQIVLFFDEGDHVDPHVLQFETKEKCQAGYTKLKRILREGN